MLVFSVLALTVIFAFAAFAIDMGQLVVARHRAQLAADSGALAAAADFPTNTTSIANDATTFAHANVPAGTVTVSEPQGMSGTQVQVQVSQPVSLAFGSLFHLSQGTVSANAVAKDQANQAQVAGGDISPAGCAAAQSNPSTGFCSYNAGQTVGSGPWVTTSTPLGGSVNLQGCGGGTPDTNCTDPTGAPINDEVIDLNGKTAGGITQAVTTVAGDNYILSFDLTGNPAGFSCTWDTFTGNVQITDPNNGNATLASQSFTHTNTCSGTTETANFETVTVAFAATSSSTTITFNSTTDTQSTLLTYQPLVSASDGHCLDDAGQSTSPGSHINQYTCNGGTNQQMRFVPVSGIYGELQVQKSGLDIAVSGGSKSSGTADIVQAVVDGSAPTLWNPVQEADGSWSFVNQNSGLCLDLLGTTIGAQLDQSACTYGTGSSQDFTVAGGVDCGTPPGSGTNPCDWYGPEVTGIHMDYSSAALIQ